MRYVAQIWGMLHLHDTPVQNVVHISQPYIIKLETARDNLGEAYYSDWQLLQLFLMILS